MVGGAERVIEALCLDLPAHGFEVGVACFREPGPVGESLVSAGVEVASGLAPRAHDPSQVLSLRHHLRRVHADLVYVLDHSNVLFHGRLAARSLGLPQLCAVHRTRRADGSPSLGRADRALMGLSQRVVAVSEGHRRYLVEEEGLPADRVVCIHNGVDPRRYELPLRDGALRERRAEYGLPPEAAVFAVVAALRPEKNHEALLRALTDGRLVHDHLAVVGDGSRRAELEALARELGVADRVHWLGRRDDVPRILACIDVLVLPSHPFVETFPLCVLEAMAAARPVVATRVGSLEEMVEPGVTGALVSAGDQEALVVALRGLDRDPSRREQLGVAGRQRVIRHFTRERMVWSTAELLRELLGHASM